MKVLSIILAAGKGSRMKSNLPKPLHLVAGKTLLDWLIDTLKKLKISNNIFVLGYKSEQVKIHQKISNYIIQDPQLGTGHAIKIAKKKFSDFKGLVLINYADTPFISKKTIRKLIKSINNDVGMAILGFKSRKPSGYGRIIINNNLTIEKIIEEEDADDKTKKIMLCNSGVLVIKSDLLHNNIDKIKQRKNGEYFLTDLVEILKKNKINVSMIEGKENEFLGINTRYDLAKAEEIIQDKLRKNALGNGVTLHSPNTVFFQHDTMIDNDVIIEPNVIFGPSVKILKNSIIRSFSYLEKCSVGENCTIGPYARIRPETIIKDNVKIGNFVEIKKSVIGKNSKINHLSYVGDTTLGISSNIGAGTITCNYDGNLKHKTIIGNNVFIGSNASLIAPITIENDVIIGAGSTISKNISKNSLAVERSDQKIFKNKGFLSKNKNNQ